MYVQCRVFSAAGARMLLICDCMQEKQTAVHLTA